MVNTAAQAVAKANASTRNVPGTCQLWTRNLFLAPSAGDQDGDGDADAVDGWKSEPRWAQHPGDRNPPKGAPVAWGGGSRGYGHRAISLGRTRPGGPVMIRSTDAGGSGVVATVELGWVERSWGLSYLGWSETITGNTIPGLLPEPKPEPVKRGRWVDRAIRSLNKAHGTGDRGRLIKRALRSLKRIKPIKGDK